jgi:hypothetical protein
MNFLTKPHFLSLWISALLLAGCATGANSSLDYKTVMITSEAGHLASLEPVRILESQGWVVSQITPARGLPGTWYYYYTLWRPKSERAAEQARPATP